MLPVILCITKLINYFTLYCLSKYYNSSFANLLEVDLLMSSSSFFEADQENKICSQDLPNKHFKWINYLQNVPAEVTLDLSQRGITNIPDEFMTKFYNLQQLYLEGNDLTELSQAFFPSLKQLKWLDLRNNKLSTVPNSIVDHPSLEVLLLEGNNIKTLPVEIGSLPHLRGIQLARNPLIFPPEEVVNLGVKHTLEFLRRQWQQVRSPQHIQLSHSQFKTLSPKTKPLSLKKQKTGACKSAVVLQVNSHKPRCPRRVQSSLCTAGLSKCISVRPISNSSAIKQTPPREQPPPQKAFNPRDDERKSNIHNEERRVLPLPDNNAKRRSMETEDIQPKMLQDLWIEKIRRILMAQETIIQRRKNAEALKQWQGEAQMQQTNLKKESFADIKFPYDTDPEYLKMLSRKESKEGERARRDSSLHCIRHEEPINGKIISIMTALQELQTSQASHTISPRSEQKVLAQEIKKIKEIQRSLNELKLKNFGQLALSL